jgi:hypothetical protein
VTGRYAGDVDRIRLARAGDAAAIAALQAESWRHTYRGFLADAYLDREVFADRDVAWRRRFGEPQETPVLTLVAEDHGAMVGFAHSYVDDDPDWGTLLDNLHVRPDRKRAGDFRLRRRSSGSREVPTAVPGAELVAHQPIRRQEP